MHDLVKMALVGSGKHPGLPIDAEHPAEALLAEVSTDDREHHFLLRAGVRAVYQQAAQTPVRGLEALPLSPLPIGTACSQKITEILRKLFNNETREAQELDFLLEVLEQMSLSEITLPPEVLPLALKSERHELRERLIPVMGDHGRWLAQFHPTGAWVIEGTAALSTHNLTELRQQWDEGNLLLREQVLKRLRQAEPSTARSWLEAGWKQDNAEHRQRLIETLQVGLSDQDEPFLEDSLSDRSEIVRSRAANLLVQLTNSRLSSRMRQRGETFFEYQPGASPKLTSRPPQETDVTKEWTKDGISLKGEQGRSQRGQWMEAILRAIHPSHWEQHFSATPQQLLEATEADDFRESILNGWTEAVVFFSSKSRAEKAALRSWGAALVRHWSNGLISQAERVVQDSLRRLQPLVSILPAETAEPLVLRILNEMGGWSLLSELPRPWSVAFSRDYLRCLRKSLETPDNRVAHSWSNCWQLVARCLPKECLIEAQQPWEVGESKTNAWMTQSLHRATHAFCDLVRNRQELYAELAGTLANECETHFVNLGVVPVERWARNV